ncbi:helix-turn-helix domain-containing protein [Seleniivibrio woodruffii]|jgi:transcriptional regulator with XRE-family HTH domain|uniref:Transcriptional regulator with XRE-family HTH domain n=1 Tax=Seleniivibrio woodruffii TaxID=1078050 RepID=A0A4R1K348_9BACT|nr:helix-turn-helix transcriptional regulator [Seleniivibrio woodruffii]TCK58462.1 transcriptional regulator with XRE-family HTH domain [Seleniivibrio woodruffii]TVZ36835.1 transcriptional regulator with XRE-family HTH domain [Seleniivibrio woodruffii]
MSTTSERMRTLIKEKGMKQIDVCKALGLSPSRLSNYLSGNRMPSIEILSNFSAYLGVSLDYFNTIPNPSDEIDEKESLKNYVRFLSELAKPVKIEVITDLGVRKFEINSTKVSSLISSTANL